ncbi:MAG: cytochrome C oxidase subunit IV family protein [Myxococcales bacterium]
MTSASAPAGPSALRYVAVWLTLVGLTFLTFGLVYVDRGLVGFLAGLAIAVGKASLVAMFFMHLWDQRGINRLVFVVALAFLGLLIGLVVADAGTRFPPAVAHGPSLQVPRR